MQAAFHCRTREYEFMIQTQWWLLGPSSCSMLCMRVIMQEFLSESVYPVALTREPTQHAQRIYMQYFFFSPTSQCLSNVKITLGPISRKNFAQHNSHWESALLTGCMETKICLS